MTTHISDAAIRMAAYELERTMRQADAPEAGARDRDDWYRSIARDMLTAVWADLGDVTEEWALEVRWPNGYLEIRQTMDEQMAEILAGLKGTGDDDELPSVRVVSQQTLTVTGDWVPHTED